MPLRKIRRLRTKKKLDYNRPVVIVHKSNKNVTAQLLEPKTKMVLCGFNSSKIKKGTKTEKAIEVGKQIAQKIKEFKYDSVLFDRNGFLYHGRIKAIADAIRSENITI